MAEDTRSILSTAKDVFNITSVSAHHCVTVQVILQQDLMGSRLQQQITWTTHLESSDRCRAAKRLLAMMRKQQIVLAGMGHSEMSTTVADFVRDHGNDIAFSHRILLVSTLRPHVVYIIYTFCLRVIVDLAWAVGIRRLRLWKTPAKA